MASDYTACFHPDYIFIPFCFCRSFCYRFKFICKTRCPYKVDFFFIKTIFFTVFFYKLRNNSVKGTAVFLFCKKISVFDFDTRVKTDKVAYKCCNIAYTSACTLRRQRSTIYCIYCTTDFPFWKGPKSEFLCFHPFFLQELGHFVKKRGWWNVVLDEPTNFTEAAGRVPAPPA